jgi:serine phosphatase RsbU (regulator of sigma subunit)
LRDPFSNHFLPKVRPQIRGFEVAGWNQPADDTGGDFYDWKKLPDGRWVVILADVTGHGIGPAILASVCRAYSRATFNVRESLERMLKNINLSFAEDLTPERFATFVAAVCQEGSDQLELLSAGHAPILVYSSEDKSLSILEAQVVKGSRNCASKARNSSTVRLRALRTRLDAPRF